MIVRAEFDYSGKHYEYYRPVLKFDRNYEDEGYAYFLERIPETENGLFEVNLLKDESNGKLFEDGYVGIYEDEDEVMPKRLLKAYFSFWY